MVIKESTVPFSPLLSCRVGVGAAEKSDDQQIQFSKAKTILPRQELCHEFRAVPPAAFLTSRSLVWLPDVLPSPPCSAPRVQLIASRSASEREDESGEPWTHTV